MRALCVKIAMLLVLAVGTFAQLGCGGTCTQETCGAEGQPCYDWTNGCDDDTMGCVNGTCTKCGYPGEACCPQISGPDDCYESTCDESGADVPPTCTTACGLPGLPCCADQNYPCGDNVCNADTGVCEGQITACGGSDPHWIHIVDPFGCASWLEPFTADPENVQACIDQIVALYPPGATAGPLDTDPGCAWSCQYWDDTPDASTGADPVFTCAFSTAEQETCKASLCSNCLFTNEAQNVCGEQY